MKKVLIVDDSLITRQAIQRYLPADSVKPVGQATNGEEGLSMFLELKPDIVTLDITMPGKDGLECIQEMLVIDPGAKIIVVTALADKQTAVEALTLGAAGFVGKPFSKEEIESAIEQVVSPDTLA